METKSESCTRGEVEFFRVLFNNNLRARDIYKNTINDILRNLFADNYHNKRENGEIPGVYDLEKPGRSVINYMNTNYSVFCIMVRDLNRVITKSLKEKSVNFEGKTPAEQISEMKRLCNYIEQFSSRIFDPNSQTFHSIMNTLKEKDNVGTRRENMAQVRLQESIPNAKVIVTAGAGKTKDAIQKIDMEIVVENSKLTAQVKGFDEILEQNGRLVVTKTGEVAKYNVDWMVFVKGKKVVVFENKGEIVMGNYVFEKTQMIYDLR